MAKGSRASRLHISDQERRSTLCTGRSLRCHSNWMAEIWSSQPRYYSRSSWPAPGLASDGRITNYSQVKTYENVTDKCNSRLDLGGRLKQEQVLQHPAHQCPQRYWHASQAIEPIKQHMCEPQIGKSLLYLFLCSRATYAVLPKPPSRAHV